MALPTSIAAEADKLSRMWELEKDGDWHNENLPNGYRFYVANCSTMRWGIRDWNDNNLPKGHPGWAKAEAYINDCT